ncbi:MAG: hypothetical protein ACYC6Y_25880, partial [Thermoguttaceae bacterium]
MGMRFLSTTRIDLLVRSSASVAESLFWDLGNHPELALKFCAERIVVCVQVVKWRRRRKVDLAAKV